MIIHLSRATLDLSTPVVMGILNVTPDSFHDGGSYPTIDSILARVEQMLLEGATIIDVGGMTTKPGSQTIDTFLELERVIAPIAAIAKRFPQAIISIDTIHAAVATEAVAAGAQLVNDISAGSLDAVMIPTVAALGVPYIIMHLQGTPATMQLKPTYENVVTEVITQIIDRVAVARAGGIKQLIIDPGFGFGKNVAHNYQLLKNLKNLQVLELPILAGLSRKSMITAPLGIKNKDALNGTTVLNTIALLQGANILRVHDVKEAVEAIKLVGMMDG